jgi:hypothetical protein
VAYQDHTGVPPPVEYPWLTCLIGTGAYVFHEYDAVALKVHEVANRNYWAGTMLREDVNLDGIVNIYDAVTLKESFYAEPGDPTWYYGTGDVNGNSIVDYLDYASVIQYPEHYWQITLPAC